MSTEPMSLVHFDRARMAIEKAATIDEVKEIRDRAEALRVYHRQSGQSLEMQNRCAEIKIRAERRAGDLLSEVERGQGKKAAGLRSMLDRSEIPIATAIRWQLIARVKEADFEAHIAEIKDANKELTTAGVLKILRASDKDERLAEMGAKTSETAMISEFPEGKRFSTIYADPPWRYGNQGTRAATDNHYPTMTVDEIAALPIASIADDNAHLHLWTTNAFLPESFRVISAWGFEYKSCFLWVKPQMGIGNYWRVSHEFLLLGVRGNCPFLDRGQMSWQQLERTGHSNKPDRIRQIIEKVSPAPRIELFARQLIDGWTCWGNEVSTNLFTHKDGMSGNAVRA